MRIVLTTIGSLGDLHPFIAVGQALAARGAEPVLAVPEAHVAKCRAAGLVAEAIMPDFHKMTVEQGLDPDTAIRRSMQNPDFILRRVVMPYLASTAEALEQLSGGACAIVGSSFSIAAACVAERLGIPFVPAALQPMLLMSAVDPPRTPEFRMMARRLRSSLALAWNRAGYAVIRTEMRRRHGATIQRLRTSLGLAPSRAAPLLDWPVAPPMTLALYSAALAPLPPDAPPNTMLTGFPWFDSDSGRPETLSPDLAAFLEAGDPPLVFTLGSFAVYAPGSFYAESVRAARSLGRRAVLLLGPETPNPAPGSADVFACAYAPHSLVFPRAAAIIHHGGVGTTGQALRAGRPQLIVPHMADQPDHASRLSDAGLALALSASRYKATTAAQALHRLLHEPAFGARAKAASEQVRAETGATAAAEALLRLLAPADGVSA